MVEGARDNDARLREAGERLAAELADAGFSVVPGFLSPREVHDLRAEGGRRRANGEFHSAGVGRGGRSLRDTSVRGDSTCWLDAGTATAPERDLLAHFDVLAAVLNRTLMVGIVGVEAHYACYPPGAGYARHLDRFRDDDARVLSLVLYLNEDWGDADGGALRLYGVEDGPPGREVAPRGGTLVAMRSDAIEHEVLPAAAERWSIAAWMRRRAR